MKMMMDEDEDYVVVEQPPRATSKVALPQQCILSRTSYNRDAIFVKSAGTYEDLRASTSITQHVDRTSKFHSLRALNNRTAEDYEKTDLCCWNDSFPFTGRVYPAPKGFDAKTGTFVVYGCFW